jgi:predicted membrane protein
MDETPRVRSTEKVLFGLALVALGAIFILDNLHLIYAGRLWDYWPIVMIVPGLARLLQPNRPGQRVWGAILVVLGGLFLLRNLAILWIPFHRVWPALLVVLGLYLVWQAMARRGVASTTVEDASNPGTRAFDGSRAGLAATAGFAGRTSVSQLNEFALCGGGHRVVQSTDFRGGSITVVAGGFDIDLREAAIAGDSVSIELFVMMGGVVLRIPESWKVVVNVSPLLGGSDLKARTIAPPDGAVRTLVVNGFILMGGLEVKN